MKTRDLRTLVMHVSVRCDQTCAHCSIWKGSGRASAELGVDERLALLEEAHRLGARAVLFTGGEPLLCDHIEVLARGARRRGLQVQIATNGLGLSRALPWIAELVQEVYLSLEGPEPIHDGVRGARMYSRLEAAIASVRTGTKRPRLIGRSVLSSRNAACICDTVAAARKMGLDAISFLPVDVATKAFGGDPSARAALHPSEAEVSALRKGIRSLAAAGDLGGFVMEDEGALTRIADRLLEGSLRGEAPACNAPEWSSVVEANGDVRPCFFQPVVGRSGGASLEAVRNSRAYAEALGGLGAGNPICAVCVCPKYAPSGVQRVRARVGAVLRRLPRGVRPGASA